MKPAVHPSPRWRIGHWAVGCCHMAGSGGQVIVREVLLRWAYLVTENPATAFVEATEDV